MGTRRMIRSVLSGVMCLCMLWGDAAYASSGIQNAVPVGEQEGVEEESTDTGIIEETAEEEKVKNADSQTQPDLVENNEQKSPVSNSDPINLNMIFDSKTYMAGDEVLLRFCAERANEYEIIIVESDTGIIVEDIKQVSRDYRWKIEKSGNYTVYFRAFNNKGSAKSQEKHFKTYDAKGSWIKFGKRWKYKLADTLYVRDTLIKIGEKYYLFDDQGYMMTGWQYIDGKWIYFDTSGARASGWIKVKKCWYFLNEEGVRQTGWQLLNGDWYYLESSGRMVTGWKKYNGKWYYLETSGAMATGWTNVNGKWYYLQENGIMATGWIYLNDHWYYLDTSGKMLLGWNYIGGVWYHFNTYGEMQTGWQKINGAWYYLKESGAMQTGWLKENENWYFLKSDGSMAVNWTIINGKWYYFDASGKWIEGKIADDVFIGTCREKIVAELEAHQYDSYYLGTRYAGLSMATGAKDPCMHPNGSPGNNGYTGLNCTGFVAFVVQKCGGDLSKIDKMGRTGGYVNATSWLDYAKKTDTVYYKFESISSLLASGKAEKRDIIYCEPDWSKRGADCHIGFFWGDTPSSDVFWHQVETNIISNIKAGTPQIRYYLIKTGV
ncbi:hypothetical protein ACTNA4_05275 [Bariatricus sp. HCP28S3_A7]|uniref:hypothetical protein n=1 Tax=Bariatricus sp. HCP28S3_A7 TaxID=3438894 RepID=UPI003F8B8E6E